MLAIFVQAGFLVVLIHALLLRSSEVLLNQKNYLNIILIRNPCLRASHHHSVIT